MVVRQSEGVRVIREIRVRLWQLTFGSCVTWHESQSPPAVLGEGRSAITKKD
jgi:hypothetical protein